jgi:FkbM family methyltransferase
VVVPMNWLAEQLETLRQPAAIVHIGAGSGAELADWQRSGAQRIVLVEPDPEKAADLRRRASGVAAVEVVEAAVATEGGRGQIRLFNFPQLNSLREATGLYRSMPGLQQTGHADVEVLTAEQLLDSIGIAGQAHNWLVIEAPGEEAALLDQLQRAERLHFFAHLFLTAGRESLYEGAQSAQDLREVLESNGFDAAGKPDDADADWTRIHFVLDRRALECKRLETQLAEANQARTEAEEQHRVRIAELEAEVATQRKKAEELAGELQSTRAEVEKLNQSLDDLKSAKAQFEQLSNDQARQIEEYQKQQSELDERQTMLDAEVERAEAQLELMKDVLIREKNF